ncbi:WAT1-related At1g25270-like [Olea europaea subsp. europaea]|uniref:WAT1-related protein n=1 Tax=Olea europaea subsp. europaea TaxID=158383 RepID=A0A8S0PAP4_OLEEU|nr:WAT1-related At1g25270-like [Olea europaea subsp. europaea]CAA2934755.1 WAT1-related At1g25270-like [Olea europaea subsp. europaea]CAA2934756.1 WAT1-related At1g25270-like [Olea europaea subsp. europaea]
MEKICDIVEGLKPIIIMVGLQIILTGVNIFYKLAANCGMSLKVLVAYRFVFASLTVIPLALILERQKRPKLTWRIAFQAFLIALFGGSMAQNLYAESLALTSATFAAAMTNLIPAITFVLAILFRFEKLGLNTKAGKAKVLGTLMSLGGAMLLTFYKGCQIDIWSTHFDLMKNNKHPVGHVAASHKITSINQILGPLLAFTSCASVSFSIIFQAKMSKGYPCHYSSSALISVMGTIQALTYALSMERNWKQWKLGWNLKLLTVAYMGIMGSGLMMVCSMCCVRMRGPLFVSIFNPLLLVLVAIAGSLLLNEKLHLGSVIGATIIVLGLYAVLWGKSKEIKRISTLMPTKNFKEGDQADNIASESIKNVRMDHSSSIMAIAPNFLRESEIEMLDEEEAEKEVNVPRPNI